VRSVLYRFPDLNEFERMMSGSDEGECELGLPAGEIVDDGEWILAIFELGATRRATSAAARAVVSPDGSRLIFELRDWTRLVQFAQTEARSAPVPAFSFGISAAPTQPPPTLDAAPAPEPPPPSTAPSAADTPPDTARSPAPHRSVRPSGPGARVLIVDDDPDIRDLVSTMLEAVGLIVAQAPSAEEALERIRTETFELLVLDWNLPKMTGLDLCRLIRREVALASLPVLFLTANASSQDMVEAFACGGDDYVVKPFRAPELGARIFSLLRRTRAAG
jgi:two-component system phosphate regulon response regulator PhoB